MNVMDTVIEATTEGIFHDMARHYWATDRIDLSITIVLISVQIANAGLTRATRASSTIENSKSDVDCIWLVVCT